MFIIFSRHADVTGNEPNIFSGECVACCLERSGVLSSTVEIDREREDISAHLQTEGKVIVEVNSNTHQLIKCWLKAMEIDHNDCKIDFYDLLDEVVTDLKYKPFSYNLDNQRHDEIQRYKEKGQDYGRNTSCLLSVLSSVTEFSCHVYQVNKEGNLIDIWISAETPNHNRCVQLVYYRSRKSFDVVVSSTKYEEWLMRMEIDHNDKGKK